MSAPLATLAAGGTGGHMFPAQALAETLLSRGWRVELTTDPRGARYTSAFPREVPVRVLSSATFARGGALAKAGVPFRIGSGTAGALWRFRRDRPACVIGFGGYPSIPALAAATILKLPRLIHEQNGVLGRVNQVFAKRVDAVACGTWPTELPEEVDHLFTGNPVRAAVLDRAGAPYIAPGDYPMSLVVFGGSQGAKVISDVVPQAVAMLPRALRRNIRVHHQARDEDAHAVATVYAEADVPAEVAPFFHDMPRLLSEAQLVICRSGASTVADLSVIGRPSILIPFAAAIRDEQTANARTLSEHDAAILIPERRLDAETLSSHVAAILEQPDAASRMARAALAQGRPEAASDLADMVEALAGARR